MWVHHAISRFFWKRVIFDNLIFFRIATNWRTNSGYRIGHRCPGVSSFHSILNSFYIDLHRIVCWYMPILLSQNNLLVKLINVTSFKDYYLFNSSVSCPTIMLYSNITALKISFHWSFIILCCTHALPWHWLNTSVAVLPREKRREGLGTKVCKKTNGMKSFFSDITSIVQDHNRVSFITKM